MARAPQASGWATCIRLTAGPSPERTRGLHRLGQHVMEYGHTLYTRHGVMAENIKITTPSDYYMFKSFVEAEENKQIFGY